MLKKTFLFLGMAAVLFTACQKDDTIVPDDPETVMSVVVLDSIYQIGQFTAKADANVTSSGSSFVSARGICISRLSLPDINDTVYTSTNGTGTYTISLGGLEKATLYHVRAFATNSEGTSYSAERTFTTSNVYYTMGAGVTDIDGNAYQSIIIGNQEWMRSNLNTTKFSNGDALNSVDFFNSTLPSYATSSEIETYFGRQYNVLAVDDPRNVCPTGWHVSSRNEWDTLIEHIGGVTNSAIKLRTDTEWFSNMVGLGQTFNTSGFTALPSHVIFGNLSGNVPYGSTAIWWTSTSFDSNDSYYYQIDFGLANANPHNGPKNFNGAIRCVKD